MTDEFEDRENEVEQDVPEGLGDLPTDKSFARGDVGTDFAEPDFIPPGTLIQGRRGSGIPKDIAREQRVLTQADDGSIGSTVLPFGVTSVYDARPINARDFLKTEQVSFTVDLGDPNSTRTVAQITVPGGYVGVWQKFSIEPGFVTGLSTQRRESITAFTSYSYTLLLNGTVVPGYEDMNLGPVVNTFDLPTWVLGLENNTFGLSIIYSIEAGIEAVGNGNDLFFNVTFYGNELLTRGVPLPFQIATQVQSGGDN